MIEVNILVLVKHMRKYLGLLCVAKRCGQRSPPDQSRHECAKIEESHEDKQEGLSGGGVN